MDSLLSSSRASPIAQQVRNLPAMQETQETWVQSLGGEDPLEKETATHSNILAWKIPGTEDPGGQKANGSQRDRHNWVIKRHTCTRFFQVFSCLHSSHSASGCRRKNIYNMMDGWRMMGSGCQSAQSCYHSKLASPSQSGPCCSVLTHIASVSGWLPLAPPSAASTWLTKDCHVGCYGHVPLGRQGIFQALSWV